MICPRCGREIPDGTVCPCSTGVPTAPNGPALSSNPALNVLKTIGSSPLFLTAAILCSANLLLNIIISLSGGSTAMLYQFSANLDIDPSLYPYLNNSMASNAISEIIGMVPSILVVAAYWIHYATCKNQRTGNISTAGLTIWKVMDYIVLVLECILAVLVLVGAVLLLVAGIGDSSYYIGAAIGLLLGGAVGFGLMIPYVICEIRVINHTKAVAASGIPDNYMPQYLIVMRYIAVVFGAIGGLVMLFTSPLAGLAAIANVVSTVLVTVSMSRYRGKMVMLRYPPVQPVYAQPVQPAQGGYPQPGVPTEQPPYPNNNDGNPQG